jgi:predicted metal-dependent peptidase
VEEKMDAPPTVFIYLTDGFGEAPAQAPVYPVIWCLTKGGEKPADWGLEVKIKEK